MGNSRNPGRRRSIDDEDPKKKKNRDAARKCREKKVKETTDLKKKNEELTKTNEDLAKKKIDLERRLQECIEEIKTHKASGCELPKRVEDIINCTEYSPDFIPIGTQIISSGTATNGGHCGVTCRTGRQSTESFSTGPPTPTATGLFSGAVLSVNQIQQRVRHTSSRSSSRSPPPTARSPQPIQSALLSKTSTHPPAGLAGQPSWARLHHQTVGELSPPGLSPAQTVPNIDTDLYTVADTYEKNNGFPDIDEAVKRAQEDPAVMEDGEYQSESNQGSYSMLLGPPPENVSLPSLGFSSNTNNPLFHPNRFVPKQGIHGNQPMPLLAESANSLKRKSPGTTTVSMNHTAELLSQAMINFDNSEISEDLKRQFEQLENHAQSESDRETVLNSQSGSTNAQIDWEMEGGSSHVVLQPQQAPVQVQQAQSSASTDQMSYDALLELARTLGQNVTVQYKGTDYECNYEQLELLISYIKQESEESVQQGGNNHAQSPVYLEATSAVVETVPVNTFSQGSSTVAYTSHDGTNEVHHAPNINYIPENNYPAQYNNAFNQRTTPPMPIPQVVEVQDQNVQLPTTVLSMIQEDTLAKSGPSNEMYLDSVDYSENVRDLPSLSLTEDHTHIFEKRRRLNND